MWFWISNILSQTEQTCTFSSSIAFPGERFKYIFSCVTELSRTPRASGTLCLVLLTFDKFWTMLTMSGIQIMILRKEKNTFHCLLMTPVLQIDVCILNSKCVKVCFNTYPQKLDCGACQQSKCGLADCCPSTSWLFLTLVNMSFILLDI